MSSVYGDGICQAKTMMLLRRILRYIFAFNFSKTLFNALLPRFMRRKIASGLDLDTGPFNRPIDDVELIPIQPDSYLAVYTKRNGTNVGPGVSLYVFENEILRFDCFGGDRGHYHSLPCLSALTGNERNDFSSVSIEAQIYQALAEIPGNYIAHLARHFRRRIREFKFDQAQLELAVSAACVRMLIAEQSTNE